ncbi:MAG: hypothetical protein IMF19_07410 [Proteobacteria bacterium]|nr:hypothetical protein [Pseudomonadota bacterium]
MEEIVTSDWGKFGTREIEEAKELLSHIKEIESYGKVEVCFNTHSGYVFLSDENYKVWMMNGDKIEEWYSCPYCGHEGFLGDMEHEPEDEECTRYMKEIKQRADEEEK